jgi:glycosyl hydrolase family 11
MAMQLRVCDSHSSGGATLVAALTLLTRRGPPPSIALSFNMEEARMALKRIVTGAAAVALLACSDSPESTPGVPAFSGIVPVAPNSAPVNPVGTEGQVPIGANPDPSSTEAGVEVNATPGQSPSEGQIPDIAIIGSEEPPAPSGGEVSGEDDQAPPPAEEEEPVPEEPVPEEPAPIVRPALNCGAPPPVLQGGVQGCEANDGGSVGGLDWFLWYTGGSGCMTSFDNNSAGAFTAQWNNPSDFLARSGFWFDETQTFEEIGEIGADMAFTKQGSAGGFSFIGIYGWTLDPLVEYYIVEDSYGNGPAQPFNTQQRGSVNMDGGQYNIYSGARVNLPSIIGNANFTQVLSVRQSPRQCGHVSISEHFRQWERMGINLGLAKEAKILVEAGGGNGSITFSHANVTITPPD